MPHHSSEEIAKSEALSRCELPTVAETTFHVRYAETDQMGIVHHSAYIVWFEEGRSAWSRQVGRPYADFERAGYPHPAGMAAVLGRIGDRKKPGRRPSASH
jgi:hypothetical protein